MPVFDYKAASSGGYSVGTATGTEGWSSTYSAYGVTFSIDNEPAAFVYWPYNSSGVSAEMIPIVRYDGSETYATYYNRSKQVMYVNVTGLVNVEYRNGKLTLTSNGSQAIYDSGSGSGVTYNLIYLY